METGDKEDILEAIGVFAERVDERFESIDRRFEKIESTMATKAGLLDVATKDDLANFATKVDIANIMDTLDWLVAHAKKHDDELLMLARGLKRVTEDVERIKPRVGLKM